MKRTIAIASGIILISIISIIGFYSFSNITGQTTFATIARVIDGDTVSLANGKQVRLIGIDAPERGVQYYEQSKSKLEQLVEGKNVILEEDVEKKDRYDRLLRYLYVDDVFVNLEMVRSGYANVYIVLPNEKYAEELTQAENEAIANKVGLWQFSDYE